MRLFTAIALSFLVVSPLALAQSGAGAGAGAAQPAAAPPSAEAVRLAQKLYDDNRVGEVAFDNLTSNVLESAFGATRRAMAEKGVESCPALQQPWQNFQTKMRPMLNNLADAQFRQTVVNLYASAYTESELREITTFVESPTGKKFLAIDPQIGQRIMMLANDKAKPREAQVNSAMTEYGNGVQNVLKTCPAAAQAPAGQPPARKPAKK